VPGVSSPKIGMLAGCIKKISLRKNRKAGKGFSEIEGKLQGLGATEGEERLSFKTGKHLQLFGTFLHSCFP